MSAQIITLEPPKSDHYLYNRLISEKNVIYFMKSKRQPIICDDVSVIDKNLRILALFLISQNFEIYNFQAIQPQDKLDYEKLFNSIKSEEKDIRKEGINLKDYAGTNFLMKNQTYRIRYPSFDAFMIDYPDAIKNQFICFGGPRNDTVKSIANNKTTFGNELKIKHELDKIIYTIVLESSETDYKDIIWRRYTQDLVKTVTKAKQGAKI